MYDRDFMSGGFGVEVSPLVLMLFHEKIWPSLKLHLSAVSVGSVHEPKISAMSAIQTN